MFSIAVCSIAPLFRFYQKILLTASLYKCFGSNFTDIILLQPLASSISPSTDNYSSWTLSFRNQFGWYASLPSCAQMWCLGSLTLDRIAVFRRKIWILIKIEMVSVFFHSADNRRLQISINKTLTVRIKFLFTLFLGTKPYQLIESFYFAEATHFGFFREPESEMNQFNNGRGQFNQPAQPQQLPTQQVPSQQAPTQQFPTQPPQAPSRESDPMQLRYASPYDMPAYVPKRPAHAYASHSYPLPSQPAPQVHCPSNLLISCKLQVQDAPCEPSPQYGQY